MANTLGSITIEDYDGEQSVTTFNLQNIDQAGSNYGSVTQDLDELKDSILTVIEGVVRNTKVSKKFLESSAEVTDPDAQRERKWLVTMRDTLQYLDVLNAVPNPGYNRLFSVEIACANPALLLPHSDEMDPGEQSGDVGFDFIESMEANARSPWNNNPEATVTPTQEVVSVRMVGRAT